MSFPRARRLWPGGSPWDRFPQSLTGLHRHPDHLVISKVKKQSPGGFPASGQACAWSPGARVLGRSRGAAMAPEQEATGAARPGLKDQLQPAGGC